MVIAVDFDGTIVEHAYPKIGRPIPFAIDVLKKIQETGLHQLILWTVREGDLLDEAIKYCEEKGLKFYAANKNYPEEELAGSSRKLTADLFIDDRNLGGLPDWGIIYKLVLAGGNNLYRFEELMGQDETNPRKEEKNFFIRLGEAWDKARGKGY